MAAASLRRASSRFFSVARSLRGDSKPVAPAPLGVTGRIPDDMEQSTGLERLELEAIAKGNPDPFGIAGAKVGRFGTKESPCLIPSGFQTRLVGCLCEGEDSELIRYFPVHAGEVQLCPCSRKQYFKLVAAPADTIKYGSDDHH